MKFPDDRRRIRALLDEAIELFIELRQAEDGRVEMSALRAFIDAQVPVRFPAGKFQAHFEARYQQWVKERWRARQRLDGSAPDGSAWVWCPREVAEGGNRFQALSPGYHIQIDRAQDDELARAIDWAGNIEGGWSMLREHLQHALGQRAVAPRRRRRRTTV